MTLGIANGKEARGMVDEMWRAYARAIWQGHKVSPAQHHETKLAFYAGGFEVFRQISTKIADQGEAQAEESMTALHNELEAWLSAERLRRLNHASAVANALRTAQAAAPDEAPPLMAASTTEGSPPA